MKVLFVCNENVSRSQMAATIYNHLTESHDADSAGINLDVVGETLGKRRKRVGLGKSFELMQKSGLDMSKRKRIQLTKDMIGSYDQVISMVRTDLAPEWLKRAPNYSYWHIPDPKGKGMQATIDAKNVITELIHKMID